ncbi:DUF3068 domain-containing protein [[Mycobacterium] burgundiense]|uniref:DUF3068 domain-containing protein n=1 Tax=[Mycobacterium] burgundiense TaxID=3064286 RepID=A0ABM9M433_9MYCO|nr:DUF3068 domain-containing protein [Mycolicibacterium sp. MU0053]CAJ1509900.1 DUF3068 domain-containing protein [Mycolicibacterium sp. MU0053]
MNRAVMLRVAACGLLGLGAALLVAALLLSTYTAGKIKKIPLDLDATLVSDGTGTALDPASLAGEVFVVDQGVPVVSQQQISVESPANADVVTLQAGTSVRRTDQQKDTGLLLAMVDTVTVNRSTAMAVSDDAHPGGSVQKPRSMEDTKAPTNVALPHEGLSYRFPFSTEKKTYPFFDPIAQKPFDANYEGEEDVNGLTTYKFTQNVGYDADGKLVKPIRYSSLYDNDEDAEVTARAMQWGVPGEPEDPVTMTRYYAAQRNFWVDPVSGTIVKAEERANHYYARDALEPEVALADYKVSFDEDTVEAQVEAARTERDQIGLWSRILPITFTAAGLIALVAGALLGSFSLRAEAELIDPGLDGKEGGFFGGFASRRGEDTGPMPAAEAETEKLPAQRPDLHPDQGPPDRT